MEIIKKPWGQEELISKTETYMVKRLTMLKDCQCSLQYHNQKTETIYVLSGSLEIQIQKDNEITHIYLMPNDFMTIEKCTIHRMRGVTDCVYLESSDPLMEDVVRLRDDYGRT